MNSAYEMIDRFLRNNLGDDDYTEFSAALDSVAAAGAAPVPEGWQLVPVEPTPEMCEVSTWDFNRFYPAKEIYKAMLAAAPKEQS